MQKIKWDGGKCPMPDTLSVNGQPNLYCCVCAHCIEVDKELDISGPGHTKCGYPERTTG